MMIIMMVKMMIMMTFMLLLLLLLFAVAAAAAADHDYQEEEEDNKDGDSDDDNNVDDNDNKGDDINDYKMTIRKEQQQQQHRQPGREGEWRGRGVWDDEQKDMSHTTAHKSIARRGHNVELIFGGRRCEFLRSKLLSTFFRPAHTWRQNANSFGHKTLKQAPSSGGKLSNYRGQRDFLAAWSH